ncbi:hypothetical protein N781_17035 [Pontibacillus halophilus JSM 076056 = DSM 19796]|uniref:Glycosyltransferase n=1 Tax=Pontibacillus halophilus JSM 076056 = DSM 19796 TaxID=1385510 RepID=A0A0A5I9C0_9BACI|nr:DUF707 domain-containing protein [Pontibacillus halophilus]KGX92432.1 hypothetical protein N781_17035 [Pontibacillus halophilus JSM 076056 = DSM 19796]
MPNRYLVISSVGDQSLHKNWVSPRITKQFDLALVYYGNTPNRYKNECDYYWERQGTKFQNTYYALKQLGPKLSDYEAVWIPDDDIHMDSGSITTYFSLIEKYDLWLSQPSLTRDSYIGGWKITANQPAHVLRYTNFAEIMAPAFNRTGLNTCLETFKESFSGFGLDFTWPRIMGVPKDRIAIVDAVMMKHTRPSKTGDLYKLFSRPPIEEGREVCRRYGIEWDDCLVAETFGAVMKRT